LNKIFIIGLVATTLFLSASPSIASVSQRLTVENQRNLAQIPVGNLQGATMYADYAEDVRKARAEGAKALEEWDAAIRENTTDTRKELRKAAVSHRTTNRNGVRIDTYVLKDGRSVICSTTVRGNSPAIMNCDGQP
jgi:hypothetical protein